MKNTFINTFIVLLIPSFILSGLLGLGFSSGPFSFVYLTKWHLVTALLIFSLLTVLIKRSSAIILSSIQSFSDLTKKRLSYVTTAILVFFGAYTFSSWFIKYSVLIENNPTNYSPAMINSQLFLETLNFGVLISLIISIIIGSFIKSKK